MRLNIIKQKKADNSDKGLGFIEIKPIKESTVKTTVLTPRTTKITNRKYNQNSKPPISNALIRLAGNQNA